MSRRTGYHKSSTKALRTAGGLDTHTPKVIEYAEVKGWDVDFYMAYFYNLRRKPRESVLVAPGEPTVPEEYRERGTPPAMCRVILATPTQ